MHIELLHSQEGSHIVDGRYIWKPGINLGLYKAGPSVATTPQPAVWAQMQGKAVAHDSMCCEEPSESPALCLGNLV